MGLLKSEKLGKGSLLRGEVYNMPVYVVDYYQMTIRIALYVFRNAMLQ